MGDSRCQISAWCGEVRNQNNNGDRGRAMLSEASLPAALGCVQWEGGPTAF